MEPHKDKSVASSSSMIEGAIFMSNRATKKECLKRKLFGLPPSQAPFVKQVKTGMILFLFEYEERKLYGVFEAASDGTLNIEPHAFNSSGKPFTAQIRFQRIWSCHPLSEPEFCDAIMDNYYTTKKFHLYLSQEQVLKLLELFSSKKIKIQRSPSIETGNKTLKQSRKHGRSSIRVTVTTDSVGNEFAMGNDTEIVNLGRHPDFSSPDLNHHSYYNKPIPNKEDFIDGQALSLPVSRSSEPLVSDFMPPTPRGDGSAMGNFHNSPLHSHCHYTLDPRFHYTQSSFSSHVAHDPFSRSSIESLLSSSKSHLHQSHVESDALDPSSTRRGSLGVSTNNNGYKVPSVSDCYGPSSVSIPSLGSEYLETRRIDSKSAEDCRDLSFTDRHEAFSASIPFLGARCFEKMSIDSRDDDGHRGLFFTDSHEASIPAIPLLQAASLGKKSIDSSFVRSPSKNLSSVRESDVHGYYPALYQHEEGHVDLYSEPSTATMHLSGDGNFIVRAMEHSSLLGSPDKDLTGGNEYDRPLESWFDDGYGRMGHHNSTHHEEYYPNSSLDSKRHDKRPSVFSRLSAAADAHFQDVESYESDADVSMSELVEILYRRRKDWRKPMKKYKPLNARNHEDQTDMDLVRADVQINEEDLWVGDGTAEASCKSPFLNFKRRSEVRKKGRETEMRGHVEGETSKGSSGKQKRRKLIRPSLRPEEPFDKDSNDCLNMDGSSQGVATGLASVQTSEGEKINGSRIIGAPVENDERDECNERGLPRKVELSGDDDSGRLEGLSNHITNDCNIEGQLQEFSNCWKSSVDVERNAGGLSLESQSDQPSVGNVTSEGNTGWSSGGNENATVAADDAGGPSVESQSDQPSVGNVTSEGNTGGLSDSSENATVTADDALVINVIGEQNTVGASDSNEISKMAVDDEVALVGNFKGKGNGEGSLNGDGNENCEGESEAFEELGEKSTFVSVGQRKSVDNNQPSVGNVEGERDANGSSEVGNANDKLRIHNALGKCNEDFSRKNEVFQVDEIVDQGRAEDYIPL